MHYLSWAAFAAPLMLLCLLACWACLLLCFMRDPPPVDPAVTRLMQRRYEQLPAASFAEKSVGACFLALLLLWIGRAPHVVPGWGALFPRGTVTDASSAMLVASLLFLLPAELPTLRSLTTLPPELPQVRSLPHI